MRPNANSRRTRGRGGRKSGNSRNQTFDSNGPGARVRGNASQIYEKYQQLARDAASGGDRVGAENFLQHAEHYYRLMSANAAKNEQRNSSEDTPKDATAGGDEETRESAETSSSAEATAHAEGGTEAPSEDEGRSNGRKRRSRKSNGRSSESFADKLDGEPEAAVADDGEASGDDGETATA